jgi:hypothetical protein
MSLFILSQIFPATFADWPPYSPSGIQAENNTSAF